MPQAFTLAILGCGAVVQELHAAVLPAVAPRVEVKLCVDVDATRATEVARRLGGSAVEGGVDALLAREPTDGVLIALPNADHAPASTACLLNGRHVLCEKPVVTSALEREQLERSLARTDRVLSVNLLRRFLPATVVLPAIARELEPIVRVDADEGGSGWPSRSGFQFVASSARGGVTLDRGPHLFDLLVGLRGMPAVERYEDDADGGVEATSITQLRWPDGARAVVRMSKLEPWQPRVTLTAADGRAARWELHEQSTITILDATGLESERRALPRVAQRSPFLEALRTMIGRWVAACRGEGANPTPFVDVRAGCLLIEQCYAGRRPLDLEWRRLDA